MSERTSIRGDVTTSRFPIRIPSPVRCERCASRVCDAVRQVPGVETAECDARTSTLTVLHDERVVSERELAQRIEALGLEARQGIEHVAYTVTGLD